MSNRLITKTNPADLYRAVMARIEDLMEAQADTQEGEELDLLGDLAVFYERQLG